MTKNTPALVGLKHPLVKYALWYCERATGTVHDNTTPKIIVLERGSSIYVLFEMWKARFPGRRQAIARYDVTSY